MVYDSVWRQEAGMKPNGGGMLCIECLEKRIGHVSQQQISPMRRSTAIIPFIILPCRKAD